MRHGMLLLSTVAVLGLVLSASAATLVVDLNGGADYMDIQSAIDAAADGDTVLVMPGEYVITEPINFNRLHDPEDPLSPPVKNIVVRSEGGAEATTIRMAAPEGEWDAVHFGSGETALSVLEGLKVTGGTRSGVSCFGSLPTLTDCAIVGNSASRGGGVYCDGSSPTLTDCTIWGNSASYGGGVYCRENASPTLTNCAISGNCGSGVYCIWDSSPTLQNCTITGNLGGACGGGVYCDGSSPTLTDCTIWGNSASYGGGVYCSSGSPTLINCIVWGNTGGALRCVDPVVTYSCIESADPWPGLGNINGDPQFCGWPANEVWVDAGYADPGSGTQADPYSQLGSALSSYRLSLQLGSPCIGTGEGGKDMGAATGTCEGVGYPQRIVRLGSGTYPIQGFTLAQHVSIEGAGQETTMIEGTVYGLRTGAVLSGVTITEGVEGGIVVASGEAPEVRDCTISGNSGGGVFCSNSSPMLTNCTISGNSADRGGGVCCSGGSPTLTNCTISGNSAGGKGGGVYCFNSSPTVTNCTISGNSAYYGAGVFCSDASSPTLTSCTISGNSAAGWDGGGGGVYCSGTSSPTLTNCTISGNSAGGKGGGGVYCFNSSPTLTTCTITENSASSGGGVYCAEDCSATLTDCTISWNSAPEGGGVSCYGSSPTLTNCTITGNTADRAGGGVYCQDSQARLTNCTITGNIAWQGAGFDGITAGSMLINCTVAGNSGCFGGGLRTGWGVKLVNCIAWGNAGSSLWIGSNDIYGHPEVTYCCIESTEPWPGEGNINTDPLFCGWQGERDVYVDGANSVGGDGTQHNPFSTLYQALEWSVYDFALSEVSPCLGAGEGGADIGAGTGVCSTMGQRSRIVHLAAGSYDIAGLHLAQNVTLEGVGQETVVIEGIVRGLRTGSKLSSLTVSRGSPGIIVGVSERPEISACAISGNGLGINGVAGVYCAETSSPCLADCRIVGNRRGTGVWCWKSKPTLSNCLLAGNQGGVYCFLGAPTLVNCTIQGNHFGVGGAFDATLSSTNCIIWGNDGGAIMNSEPTSCVVRYSCIDGEDLWPGEGNINTDPLFVQPGHWDDNGTPDDTSDDIWIEGDYHLAPGSPCIDAGTSEGAPTADIEGSGRPCAAGVDIGAYEFGGCPASPRFRRGDANASGRVDIADAISLLGYLFGPVDDPSKAKVAQCVDAADANDDGRTDIADAVKILGHLFAAEGPLPEPFGACAIDLTVDDLDCSTFAPCQ